MKNRSTRTSPWRRVTGPVLILLTALILPSCGNDSSTGLPPVQRALIFVTVDPNPVVGIQNTLTGSVSAAYVVKIQELAGLGGEVLSVTSTVFDPLNGLQVTVTFFDSDALTVFEGTSRIDPGGELDVTQTTAYLLSQARVEADLTVSVQFQDDRGTVSVSSILVHIVPPTIEG